jgi:hypothetical protein
MALGLFKKGRSVDDALKDSFSSPPKAKIVFSGNPKIAGVSPEMLVRQLPSNMLIWVRKEEARILADVVIPSIKKRWSNRNIVICDVDFVGEINKCDIPLILVDASKADRNSFCIALDSCLCGYLLKPENPMVMYVYNSGLSKSNLVGYLRLWGEGFLLRKGSDELFNRGSKSTYIIVSGVYENGGVNNCINIHYQTGFFGLVGLEW